LEGEGLQLHCFLKIDANISVVLNSVFWFQFVRLHLLLTMKDSAMDVPINLDARRRITFFANSLFMKMPRAPRVHDMISFRCVYYYPWAFILVV
jgi:callose synthase